MSHDDYIPLAERKRLRATEIKKHNLANILTHWFNVAMWGLLLPTGLAILASPRLGIVPELWQTLMRNVFGGVANLIEFHSSVGLVWLGVLTFNILVGFRRYFIPFTRERMFLDADDVEWLKVKPLQMIGLARDKKLPPQDVYNAGQKIYMYMVIVGTFTIGLTGLIMTFHNLIPWPGLIRWCLPIHFSAVGMVVAGLILHVYMGAVFPEEKEAFFSMFTGKVSAWYARRHHAKWYWHKMEEELDWEDRVLAEGRTLKTKESAAD